MKGVPKDYARVVEDGHIVLVPISGHRTQIARQRVGEGAGRTASAAVTPLELLWSGCKALGRGIRDSQEGQGFQYGWYQGQRGKVVAAQARGLQGTADEAFIRLTALELGLVESAAAAHKTSIQELARRIAAFKVENRYVTQTSYDAPVPEVVEADQAVPQVQGYNTQPAMVPA